MKQHVLITGTSRGIGHALALGFLSDPQWHVTGFSRESTITHTRYDHYPLDLRDPSAVRSIIFPEFPEAKKLVLINNAGILGSLEKVGGRSLSEIEHTHRVNLLSPVLLTNLFIQRYGDRPVSKIVVQMGSGAGFYPVGGWSDYCATKAGLLMFSQVIALEQQHGNPSNPTRVFFVSPGIVDTAMQDQLRQADPARFPDGQRFRDYYQNGDLSSPWDVAQKLMHLVQNPDHFPDVAIDLRKI